MEKALGPTRKTLRSDLALAAVVGLGATVTFAGGPAQAFPRLLCGSDLTDAT